MNARYSTFLITYVSLVTLFNSALLLLGEERVDAFIALNILCFYISYALVKPFPRTALPVKLLHATLITLFILIISIRISEVIVK
ncbi:MAG: hypothetical protein QXY95_04850 [Thermosphaera sp.]